MSTAASLDDLIKVVTSKVRPIQGTDNFDRLQGFIKTRTGGINLAAYIGDPKFTDAQKIELINAVIDVIDNNEWAELAPPPAGQAERVSVNPPPPVAATPLKPKPVAAPVVTAAPVATVVAAPAQPAPLAPPDAMTAAIVAGVLPHVLAAIPKQVAPSAPPPAMDVEAIRLVVRAEFAHLFAAIAKSLDSTPKKEGA